MPDYFTLDELRALPDMDDDTRFTDDRCEAAAEYIVGTIEREVGTSFVSRNVVGEIHDGGADRILLNNPFVLSVTQVVCSGVTYTTNLSGKSGVLSRLEGEFRLPWQPGIDNVVVDYVKGYSTVPPVDVKEQALQGTRAYLLDHDSDAGISDRRTSVSTGDGVENFIVAGDDHPTGYPEVDAMIVGWRDQLDVHGFA